VPVETSVPQLGSGRGHDAHRGVVLFVSMRGQANSAEQGPLPHCRIARNPVARGGRIHAKAEATAWKPWPWPTHAKARYRDTARGVAEHRRAYFVASATALSKSTNA
jgi:hypothetical protein